MLSFVTLSQGAPPHPGTGPHTHATTVLLEPSHEFNNEQSYNHNRQKSHDCVKKWMMPGRAQFVDHNPHIQSPELVDKMSHTVWLKPEGDYCNNPGDASAVHSTRAEGRCAAWVNCTVQPSPIACSTARRSRSSRTTHSESTCASLGDKRPLRRARPSR